ncbi:MAG: ribonuclease Y [Chitinophagia bacterium]|nr:ribonuclease Y [Chitinophagia bacterium]
MDIITIIVGFVALAIGIVIGNILFGKKAKEQLAQAEELSKKAEEQAKKIIDDAKTIAETLKENKLLEAKEHFAQLKSKFEVEKANQEKELAIRQQKQAENDNKIKQQQQSLTDKQNSLQKQIQENEQARETIKQQLEVAAAKRADLDKQHDVYLKKLEGIAGLSAEAAKNEIIDQIKQEARTKAASYVKEMMDEAKVNANKEAKKVIIQSIQRLASEQAIDNTVTTFPLESDEIKGQIIGREGRNIKALEAATGVDFVIDDTPEAIVLSCFDPFRKEIARLALQKLVQDGRIQPGRIEDVVEKTRRQMEDQIMEIGERTAIELGIHGLHKDLVRVVGKMRYRSSYGQNLLMHSKETANLCGIMAAELGLGQKIVKMAKRAGLLHDIGKVPDEEGEISHALLGAKWAEKAGEHPAIVNAIGAHHDEMEMQYIISPIVQACDAISGARPGARRETTQSYFQRLKDLEALASAYKGVERVFAIQAGRELRIMVEADKVDDQMSAQMSFEIAQRIEKEMQYPGQIKVVVVRELRVTNVAK